MFFAFSLLALMVAFLAVSGIGDDLESRVAEPDLRSLMEPGAVRAGDAHADAAFEAREIVLAKDRDRA